MSPDFREDYPHLEPRPGSNYRQLWIRGRRIRAVSVYSKIFGPDPMTPEEYAEQFQVPLEAVHEALDYVERHRDIVQEDSDRELASIRARGLDRPNRG